MLSSKDLLDRTGISRATLNNYIALGILPKAVVKITPSEGGRMARVGHFPSSALNVLTKVNELKQAGHSMGEIVEMLKDHAEAKPFIQNGPSPRVTSMPQGNSQQGSAAPQQVEMPISTTQDATPHPTMAQASAAAEPAPTMDPVPDPSFAPAAMPQDSAINAGGMRLSIDQVAHPAYLVNNMFELEWSNDAACDELLGPCASMSKDITERKLFSVLLHDAPMRAAQGFEDILRFTLAYAKNRMTKSALLALDTSLTGDEVDLLSRLYDEAEPAPRGGVQHLQVNLARLGEADKWVNIYTSFFREGIFFAYSPIAPEEDELLNLLARRDIVIKDLLKKRKPYLTPMAVLVADLQDSVKICAELPPEEYFELINEIWGAMEQHLRQFYATHGKHVGDGMVYYFFPQPDCNYVLNAIRCAKGMREAMEVINKAWKKRKNWSNELILNIGLVEGQEWFGTYQTPTHIEFTVLGDTINMAGRLSDFARGGSVWVTKAMLSTLSTKERATIDYGIRRRGEDGRDIIVNQTFSRINNLIDLDNPKNHKFHDIAVLPVAEVLDVIIDG